jgi:7-cyano-7-deazaguanine synthase
MKALVLNSGGVDSTTCVGIAVDKLGKENVATVSIFYGQKHAKELKCAANIADYYEVPHYELDLSGILKYSNCPLLANSDKEIVHASYAEQIEKNGEGMVETYVPFRNGLMLSSVAALAVSIFPDEEVEIYLGAHADDAAGQAYADCSKDFTDAMYQAIKIGTYEKVDVVAPLVEMNKAEVVKTGLTLGVPYYLTWSCYEGGEKACGTCGTCIDRQNAFIANGMTDPIAYEQRIDSISHFDPNC